MASVNRFISFLGALLILSSSAIKAQDSYPDFLQYLQHPWVDSVMNTLTLEEKIAQSIWLAAYSNKDVSHEVQMADMIRNYGVGGFVFFQGTAEKQVELINYYQTISKVPMIFAIDAEWGVGMRLTGVESFPYQMTLGAIDNDSLIYEMGKVIGEQCKATGIGFNFAPVADINNNPSNPVINYRSYGENRENTAAKALMYTLGMQSVGVLASAKHFPGHGDTDVDSHSDLPVIRHGRNRLDSLELYPFKTLINGGVGAVMTAHLNLPSLDSTSGLPSTLSREIITNLLVGELGFSGLVVSDAMNMQGVTKYFNSGEAEALALLAGNDVVEYATNVETTIAETKKLIDQNKMTVEEIDKKCRKILALKYWSGLPITPPLNKTGVTDQLNNNATKALISELYANALTLLNNNRNIIPIRNNSKVAVISVNQTGTPTFAPGLARYQSVDNYTINTADTAAVALLLTKLKGYDAVVAGVFGLNQRPDRNFNITDHLVTFLNKLIPAKNTIVAWFGNPYSIDKVSVLQQAEGLLLAYQDNSYAEDAAAQLIFGGIGAKGSLPVTINEKYPYGFGLITPGNIRMRYGYPESAGISTETLRNKIDSLAFLGLNAKAFPGCEVMIAKDGIVILHETYGYQEYDRRVTVEENDLYDIASVTKIAATLPALMVLDSRGQFSTAEKLATYIPYFAGSNKGGLLMEDILTHQAGLTPTIGFWTKTVKKNGELKRTVYRHEQTDKFNIMVTGDIFLKAKFHDNLLKEIAKSPLTEHGKYVYSDLGFMVSPLAVENITGEGFTTFIKENVYSKLGADNLVFNPLTTYPTNMLVPTELDGSFRGELIRGTVHDEAAAMFGGVAGHAGLFATGNDLMKLLEMYRRMGSYGGEQIIDSAVLLRYSSVQFPENGNRRALGFDKPLLDNKEQQPRNAYPCIGVSPESFGHSGFTGTFVWVDPTFGISYLFLSNRVYPTRSNNLLANLNIRTEMLQAIYDSAL